MPTQTGQHICTVSEAFHPFLSTVMKLCNGIMRPKSLGMREFCVADTWLYILLNYFDVKDLNRDIVKALEGYQTSINNNNLGKTLVRTGDFVLNFMRSKEYGELHNIDEVLEPFNLELWAAIQAPAGHMSHIINWVAAQLVNTQGPPKFVLEGVGEAVFKCDKDDILVPPELDIPALLSKLLEYNLELIKNISEILQYHLPVA